MPHVQSLAVHIGEENRITPESEGLARSLRTWNIVVAVVQLISFTAALIISLVDLDDARRVGLWIDDEFGIKSLGTYPIFATLVPFPFITAIFHLMAVFGVDNYYSSTIFYGLNRLRWIEYGITNGLMTFSLCVLAGAGGVVLLVVNVLANIFMQWCGYLHEKYNHSPRVRRGTLWYIAFGFLPWLQTWVTVLVYFARRPDPPLSDYFAIIGSLIWSLAFVVPLLWRYSRRGSVRDNYNMELMYIFLSLSAKLWLDWTVIIGTLVDN